MNVEASKRSERVTDLVIDFIEAEEQRRQWR